MNRFYLLPLLLTLNYCFCNQYYTYEQIDTVLHYWKYQYGSNSMPYHNNIIYNLDTIGYSSQNDLPIFAVQLSTNEALQNQNTPRVLILGQCHAEEIYGVEIAMAIIECIIDPSTCYNNVYIQEDLGSYLDNGLSGVELWVVPTHNPEGLKVVHGYCDEDTSAPEETCNDHWIEDPTYRKNIKDVVNLGTFDFEVGIGQDKDGVDLNRNYDFNWVFGDDLLEETNSCNDEYEDDYDYYKGSAPFSENEILTVRNLAIEKKFILSIAYHSSRSGCVAEKVIFPWGWRRDCVADPESFWKKSPDYSVIKYLGDKIHDILGFPSSEGAIPQCNRHGNAHDWMYRETGCFQYLIEVGQFNYDDNLGADKVPSYYIDPGDSLLLDTKYSDTIDKNIAAFFYLLMTAAGKNIQVANSVVDLGQISGMVTDTDGNVITGAIIKILEMDGLILKPRITDEFGRFRRLLHKDLSYTLEVSAPNYNTKILDINNLNAGINVLDNIELDPLDMNELILNIDVPINYNGEIQVILQDSFSSDTITTMHQFLPVDNYRITITAPELSPVLIETELNSDKQFTIQLDSTDIIFEETFDDLTKWNIQSGDWYQDSGILKTQSELFYDYNADFEIATLDGIGAEVGDSLLLEIRLRYELEWEHDSLYIVYLSSSNTTELMQLTGDQFDFITAYIPLIIGGGQENGSILLRLRSDHNLNYRGVEIDKLVIHRGMHYIGTDLSNSSNFVPEYFVLHQNFPNPFNPTTNIRFSASSISPISISIYNIRGEWIEEIVNGVYGPGYYTVRFDAGEYASGIYLYRMETENLVQTKKFMIIK